MSVDDTINWRRLLAETAELTGTTHARWLCEEASGAFGGEFGEMLDQPVTQGAMVHLDSMLERLAAGEPLQYVLGHWSFRHLDLMVDRRVLIPRPETELVVEVALEAARELLSRRPPAPLPVVDLGTGSGAIGLSIAYELPRGSVDVWLTDESDDSLDVARANLSGIGMAGTRVSLARGDWFGALPPDLKGTLALVVSNPPYVAADDPDLATDVREWEPPGALFAADGGLADLRTIATQAAQWLCPDGWLVVEIGASQGVAAADLLGSAGFRDVTVRTDLAGRDRIAVGRTPAAEN